MTFLWDVWGHFILCTGWCCQAGNWCWGTFTPRWSLWVPHTKTVVAQMWTGWSHCQHLLSYSCMGSLRVSVVFSTWNCFCLAGCTAYWSWAAKFTGSIHPAECVHCEERKQESIRSCLWCSSTLCSSTFLVVLKGECLGLSCPTQTFPFSHSEQSGCMQTAPCAWSLTPGSRAGMGLGSHKEAQVEKGRSCTKWHWGFGCSHLMEQLYLGHWVGRGNLKTCLGLLGMHMIKELRS